MKKRTFGIVVLALLAAIAFALVGCGDKGGTEPKDSLATITGVTFENATVSYDGNEHELLVSGELPDGVSVQYSGNKGTQTGTYNATATLSGEGYKTLILNATLTINGLTITGVTFAGATVSYDGNEHELLVSGELPEGVTVKYTGNKGTLPDTYNATATLSGEGYNTLTLNATLTIEPLTITGVTFVNDTVTYDGNEHEIVVSGELPAGVTVKYTDNKGTLPDTYNATAILSGAGYTTLKLTATLTIEPATITGITFEDKSFPYNGTEHSLEIVGALPQGVSVKYQNNSQTEAGTYEVKAVLSGDGYTTLTLTATLTITASEKERAVFADGNTLYFANALDGDRLYSYSSIDGVKRLSGDIPHDFVKFGDDVCFRSGASFTSRIKAIVSTGGVESKALQKAEYLCTDGTHLYFAINAITGPNSSIYKLSFVDDEPYLALLSHGKAKYLQYYNGRLYFADGENGWKLGSIATNNGKRVNVVDEKITCLTENNGVLYFTVNKTLGDYIARYDISSGTLRKLTSDAGANLTVIGNKLYYLNVDLLSSYLHGDGIYSVNENSSVDSNAFGTKVIGEQDEKYSSLTAVNGKLAYYRVSDQMLCIANTDGSGVVEVLDGFTPPEYTPLSTGSKTLAYNGNIYFMDLYNDKALYSYDPTSGALSRLTSNKVSDFSIIGETLYFNEVSYGVNNDLYSVNLRTGGEAQRVSTNDCNDIVSDGENLYYVEKNAGGVRTAIHKIDSQGNDTMIYSKGATDLTYYDGAIYFVDGKNLYKIATDDVNHTAVKIKDGNMDTFVISNGVVYFREMYSVGWALKRLSRINIDGTGYAAMMTADTDPLCIRVVGDTVYYYTDTAKGVSGIYSISINARENEEPTLILARGTSYYAEQFTVMNGKIYFVNYYNTLGDSHLYSVDISTKELNKIA